MVGKILASIRSQGIDNEPNFENVTVLQSALDALADVEDRNELRCLRFIATPWINQPLGITINNLFRRVFQEVESEEFWELAHSIKENLMRRDGYNSTNEEILLILDGLKRVYEEHAELFRELFDSILESDSTYFEDFVNGQMRTLSTMAPQELRLFFGKFSVAAPQLLAFLQDVDPALRVSLLERANDQNELVALCLETFQSPEAILKGLCWCAKERNSMSYAPSLIEPEVEEGWMNSLRDNWAKLKASFTDEQLRTFAIRSHAIDFACEALRERGYEYEIGFWEVVKYYSASLADGRLGQDEALFQEIEALKSHDVTYDQMMSLVNPFEGPANVQPFLVAGKRFRESTSPYLKGLLEKNLLSSTAIEWFLKLSEAEQKSCVQFVNDFLPGYSSQNFSDLLMKWKMVYDEMNSTDRNRLSAVRRLCSSLNAAHIEHIKWLWHTEEDGLQFVLQNQERFQMRSSGAVCFLVAFFQAVPANERQLWADFISEHQVGCDDSYSFKPNQLEITASYADLQEFFVRNREGRIKIDVFLHLLGCTQDKLNLISTLREQIAFLRDEDFSFLILRLSKVSIETLERVRTRQIPINNSIDFLNLR